MIRTISEAVRATPVTRIVKAMLHSATAPS
jgi:hypothetical protein